MANGRTVRNLAFARLATAVVIFLLLAASALAASPEDVARRSAETKGTYVLPEGGRTFEGFYSGRDGSGCDIVTVRTVWFNGRADVDNFRLCGRTVAEKAESSVFQDPIPDGLEAFAESIAKRAREIQGNARGDYSGFTVTARSLNRCDVEVRINKGWKLFGVHTLNACKL